MASRAKPNREIREECREAGLIIGLLILAKHERETFEYHQDFMAADPTTEVVLAYRAKYPKSFSQLQSGLKTVYAQPVPLGQVKSASLTKLEGHLRTTTVSLTQVVQSLGVVNTKIWDDNSCPPTKGLLDLITCCSA